MIDLDNHADKRKEKFAGLEHADVMTNVGANMNNFRDHNYLEDNLADTKEEMLFDFNVPKDPRTTVNRKEQLNGPEDNLFGTSDVKSNDEAIRIEFNRKLEQDELSIKTVIDEDNEHTSAGRSLSFTTLGPNVIKDELNSVKSRKEINLDHAFDNTTKVRLLTKILVAARSRALCVGLLDKPLESDVIIIEPHEKQTHKILTARALIRNRKEINVQLLNPNHAPIIIQKGEVIGLAYTVEETLSEEKEEVITRKLTVDSAEVEELLKTLNYPRHDTNLWRQKFEELIAEYYDIFRVPDQRLTSTTEVKHRIITEDVPPIAKRPYRVRTVQSRKDILDKEIQNLLDNDIQESTSPWSAPVILVEKKRHPGGESEFRLCIDYRELNKVTKPDFFPLPLLQHTIDQLTDSCLFSIMDMASGYFQVELYPDDREISAFSTPTGHYEFKRMAMGLRNAPSTWQRLMYTTFSGMVGLECLVYLDDVIVFSSWDCTEHLRRLRNVFERMRKTNLKFKPTKCNFMLEEAKYLGHIISAEGVKTDPEKTKAVEQ
ncbi:Retrovirus-related Pol polyprotein from transposon 17.6-like Protein [Tribolium castaneum]|uniref:Retrovirus-related Pol polyprotein from transposon 17.6-like Protein n=1 Tax=Tribolium castaneum TaxID=7070 RepID=D7EL68_TRICA|nr:Retrovirus-related Pol polyprotein from transposon 17.6-like Protein [Tribolium castaneum]